MSSKNSIGKHSKLKIDTIDCSKCLTILENTKKESATTIHKLKPAKEQSEKALKILAGTLVPVKVKESPEIAVHLINPKEENQNRKIFIVPKQRKK